MENKRCITCNIIKNVSEFYIRKDSKDGYRNDCKICLNDRKKNNPDKRKDSDKKYRDNNKDKIKTSHKKWVEKNKDTLKQYQKTYKELNKEIRNEKEKERKLNDHTYNLKHSIRNLIRQSFKTKNFKKNSKTANILGCTFDEFKVYLESQFEPWMTWENKGHWDGIPNEINHSWDIDHKVCLSTAKTEEDVIRLNHYTNLQPMCSYTNRWVKRDN